MPPPAAAPDAVVASPLRSETVSAHSIGTAPQAPVIHVTIDRLEVRAPATPSAAVPAARHTRSTESSVALSDYLRGGNRAPPRPGGRA